jgi:tRNA threonylcarbamoyl adenosine modification protein YeaZ
VVELGVSQNPSDGDSRPRYVLAIDTALGAASACCLEVHAAIPKTAESLPMERGHAEALLPLLDRLVAPIEGGFGALVRVAVTVGPGSFTGIRVGVAAARAIALACQIPVVGISTLAAFAAPLIASGTRPRVIAAIDARHGHVYAQVFGSDGTTIMEARHASADEVLRAAGQGPFKLVGSGAPMLAAQAWSLGITADVDSAASVPDIALVARLALLADPVHSPARPLYLKPPDAKPQVRSEAETALAPSA